MSKSPTTSTSPTKEKLCRQRIPSQCDTVMESTDKQGSAGADDSDVMHPRTTLKRRSQYRPNKTTQQPELDYKEIKNQPLLVAIMRRMIRQENHQVQVQQSQQTLR